MKSTTSRLKVPTVLSFFISVWSSGKNYALPWSQVMRPKRLKNGWSKLYSHLSSSKSLFEVSQCKRVSYLMLLKASKQHFWNRSRKLSYRQPPHRSYFRASLDRIRILNWRSSAIKTYLRLYVNDWTPTLSVVTLPSCSSSLNHQPLKIIFKTLVTTTGYIESSRLGNSPFSRSPWRLLCLSIAYLQTMCSWFLRS